MCGIVGYIGEAEPPPSSWMGCAGWNIAGTTRRASRPIEDGEIKVRKCVGRIANLAETVQEEPATGPVGICHTRWATHGGVTNENAHPHCDQSGKLALVHNGVIENYQTLRDELIRDGHIFHSQTDTEVLAHLMGRHYDLAGGEPSKGRLVEALRPRSSRSSARTASPWSTAICRIYIVGARRGSPLVLGIGKGENFLASDVSAIVAYTRDAVYLNDFDIACLDRESFEITSLLGSIQRVRGEQGRVHARRMWIRASIAHYMLKEIFEQPDTIRDAMRGRLSLEEATAKLGGLEMTHGQLRDVDRIVLAGCGTALHAAMAGEYLIETLAHLPVTVEFASEFRYRNMPMDKDTLVFVISQSGETADTLAALRESQRKGHRTLGICNNVASTIARESDGGVYMHAGPEIGVAATKSFTSQVTIFTLLGLLPGPHPPPIEQRGHPDH